MDRFFAQNRLSALIDGHLSAKEAGTVQEAIAKNADLSTEHASMLQAIELMRDAGPAHPPSGFHVRLMTQVEVLPAPGGQIARVRSAARRVPVEAVALIALALVVGIVITQRGSQDASSAHVPQAAVESAPVTAPHPSPTLDTEPEQAQEEEAVLPEKPSTKPPPARTAAEKFDGEIPRKTPPDTGPFIQRTGYNMLGLGDQILFKIDGLSQAHGGRMVSGNGAAIAPTALTDTQAFKRVFLVLPVTQATALHSKLKKISGKTPVPVTANFAWLRDDQALIMIEAQL